MSKRPFILKVSAFCILFLPSSWYCNKALALADLKMYRVESVLWITVLLLWKVNLPLSPLVFCATANPSSMNRRNIQTVGGGDTALNKAAKTADSRSLLRTCTRRNPRTYMRSREGEFNRLRVKTRHLSHLRLYSPFFFISLYPPATYEKLRQRDSDLVAPVTPSVHMLRPMKGNHQKWIWPVSQNNGNVHVGSYQSHSFGEKMVWHALHWTLCWHR